MALAAVTIPSTFARDGIALPAPDGDVPGVAVEDGGLELMQWGDACRPAGAERARVSDSNGGGTWDSSVG